MSLFKRRTPEVESEQDPLELLEREVEFVIVHLRDDDPHHVAVLVRTVIDRAIQTQGLVVDMHSSLVTIVYGTSEHFEEPPDSRLLLVSLLAELGTDVRAVHGRTRGLVGNIGDHGRYTFTVLMPAYGDMLRELLALHPGEAKELAG